MSHQVDFIVGREIEIGGIYKGVVTSVKEYGAFVEFNGGQQGLLHISELSHEPVCKISLRAVPFYFWLFLLKNLMVNGYCLDKFRCFIIHSGSILYCSVFGTRIISITMLEKVIHLLLFFISIM